MSRELNKPERNELRRIGRMLRHEVAMLEGQFRARGYLGTDDVAFLRRRLETCVNLCWNLQIDDAPEFTKRSEDV